MRHVIEIELDVQNDPPGRNRVPGEILRRYAATQAAGNARHGDMSEEYMVANALHARLLSHDEEQASYETGSGHIVRLERGWRRYNTGVGWGSRFRVRLEVKGGTDPGHTGAEAGLAGDPAAAVFALIGRLATLFRARDILPLPSENGREPAGLAEAIGKAKAWARQDRCARRALELAGNTLHEMAPVWGGDVPTASKPALAAMSAAERRERDRQERETKDKEFAARLDAKVRALIAGLLPAAWPLHPRDHDRRRQVRLPPDAVHPPRPGRHRGRRQGGLLHPRADTDQACDGRRSAPDRPAAAERRGRRAARIRSEDQSGGSGPDAIWAEAWGEPVWLPPSDAGRSRQPPGSYRGGRKSPDKVSFNA
jgi:hypothetical protein